MASDKSTYNKRYAVINILCRFNQSFALRHKDPFALPYKHFIRKFCVVCCTDTICPYIGHQDKNGTLKSKFIFSCMCDS